jgi:hypothetical protein
MVVLGGLFPAKLMYQSSARSLTMTVNYASFVSSFVILFSSHIFSQMNKCFSGTYDASPLNFGNLMVGPCSAIENCVGLLPLRGVYP